jgi:hypothetical protein
LSTVHPRQMIGHNIITNFYIELMEKKGPKNLSGTATRVP